MRSPALEDWHRLVGQIRSDLERLPADRRHVYAVAVAEASGGRFVGDADARALADVLTEAARFARATAPAAVPRWARIAEAYAERLEGAGRSG